MTWRASRRVARGVVGALVVAGAATLPQPAAATTSTQALQEGGRFRHESHTGLECSGCHASGGATSTTNTGWCADCHHVNVAVDQCTRCHTAGEIVAGPARALVTFRIADADPDPRSLVFDHDRHAYLGCGACHTGGTTFGDRRACTDCHADHHLPTRECSACHREPPVTAHDAEAVHLDPLGCAGAGCHRAETFDAEDLGVGRTLCLACHPAEREHEAPAPCAECHILEPDDPSGRRDR